MAEIKDNQHFENFHMKRNVRSSYLIIKNLIIIPLSVMFIFLSTMAFNMDNVIMGIIFGLPVPILIFVCLTYFIDFFYNGNYEIEVNNHEIIWNHNTYFMKAGNIQLEDINEIKIQKTDVFGTICKTNGKKIRNVFIGDGNKLSHFLSNSDISVIILDSD